MEEKATLRETYDSVLNIYSIDRDNPELWKMVQEGKIVSLFQMEQESGIQGIRLTKPQSIEDLAALNSVIRLMAQEKGAETPLEKYTRFRKDRQAFDREMIKYGLTDDERRLLHERLDNSSGLCIQQEQFMQLVQLPECGGWDLQWSDKLRKCIAKKSPKDYDALEKQFFERVKEKHLSENFCNYVWRSQIALSRGYGFNASHTAGYSLVALQEMELAHKYPIIFWNTANLIVDSAGIQVVDEDEMLQGSDETNTDEEVEEEIVSIYEPEEWEEYEYEDLPNREGKKKKKIKNVDYGRIASAIGRFKDFGIDVNPPDINKSTFTFTPNVEKNVITYGLRGITRISVDIINQIIANRPYSSFDEFMEKNHTNKLQTINLIKSGAFDCLEPDRMKLMRHYIDSIAEKKQRLTLQNMPGLIEYNCIPDEMTFYKKLFSFNKFLKTCKEGTSYLLNEAAINFISNNFSADIIEDGNRILQKTWDSLYKKAMEPMREYLKEHKDSMLQDLNQKLFDEQWDKYAVGNISKWEMESISFYYHEHELKKHKMRLDNFFDLPEEPIVARSFTTKSGQDIKIYQTSLIAGTVIDKNKMKNTVSLLTPDGVVKVKIYKNQFSLFDKQVSVKKEDGKKKVLEKSWLSRGNLLLIQGIRRNDLFVLKAYKDSLYPVISKINEVREDGSFDLQFERIEG